MSEFSNKRIVRQFTDQMGRDVAIEWPPERIVSLVPSQTELLFDLGLDREVVGLTHFCVHPSEKYKSLPRVGGTKKVHRSRVDALSPDLIIGNKEENVKEQIEGLAADYPVWLSDVHNLQDALDMIRAIATLTGREESGTELIDRITEKRKKLKDKIGANPTKRRVVYLIWRKPYMIVGSNTFINAMLAEAGFENVFSDLHRYPEVQPEDLKARNPDLILLSSEPYPFDRSHLDEFRAICPEARVQVVDGELFSWYGSRMLKSFPYFWELRKNL